MKYSDVFQKFLPFAYAFLVIVGIIKESVAYYQVGINYLQYSSITDVLMSPVIYLTSHPLIFGMLIFLIIGTILYATWINKNLQSSYAQKLAGKKKDEPNYSDEEMKHKMPWKIFNFFLFMLICLYLGFGLGTGRFAAERIKENNMKFKHSLTYSSGEKENIFLVGNNSLYYFYVPQGTQTIRITPVSAIKSVDIIDNKRIKPVPPAK